MSRSRWTRLALGVGVAAAAVIGASTLRGQGHSGGGTGDPAQDLAAVRADLVAMDKGAGRVYGLLQAAKRGKDIIKTDCVHEKLTHIRNIIALAREQYSKYLADKTSGSDRETVGLRQQLTIFKERADEKVAEAERCAGETVQVTDKVKVTEDVDPTIPQWDPTQPTGPIWVFPRPPEGSPYI